MTKSRSDHFLQAQSQRGSNGNWKGKGKRKAEGGSEDGLGDGDGGSDKNGESSLAAHSPNGRPTGSFNYSCPYRKRNPLRFNVRDKNVCATHSFTDMSQLKYVTAATSFMPS